MMPIMINHAGGAQALVNMGFTVMEAEIYAFIVSEPGVTGYRVAQAIGKPAANTYKGLESLERKGAVIVDAGESRVFRAIPPGELLAGLKRRFEARHGEAANALAKLAPPPADDRLYQLRSREQVLERCRAMLGRCKGVAVMDVFPSVVGELLPDLQQAAQRGVEVIVKAYEYLEVAGARVVVRPRGHEIVEAIPGSLVSLNIDGQEHLLAMFADDGDRVHQAIWTSSTIVAYLLYNGLINEVSQVAVMQALDCDASASVIRQRFEELRHLHPISSRGPVYQNLMRQLGFTPEIDGVNATRAGRESAHDNV